MSKFQVPAAPTLHSRRYWNLKGMDCSRDMTEIKAYRSPDLLNMISDNGGDPVKRIGWREVADVSSSIGLGKHLFHAKVKGLDGVEDEILVAVGDEGLAPLVKNRNGSIATEWLDAPAFEDEQWGNCKLYHFNGDAYLFGGGGIFTLGMRISEENGSSSISFSEINAIPEYVPEVVISRSPDGTGGTFYESINLLTDKRTFSFIGESEDGNYYLYPKTDIGDVAYKYIDPYELFVEVMNEDGYFVQATNFELTGRETIIVPNSIGESTEFDVCSPVIKINDPIASPVTGQDNVRITFVPIHAENGTYKKEREALRKANMVKAYGYSNTDRLFVVTDDRTIRYCDVNNVNYFPEDNFLTVSHKGKIVGLHRYQGYLVAITDDSEAESTVYFIHGSEYDGAEFFAVKPATSGIGAVATNTFETLVDEPLFLTNNGIYAISGTNTESRTVVRNRSYFIDRKLKEEPNLDTATAVVWNNYYILCVNEHCYVLDGRNTSNERGNNTNYVYECYYWENVPAVHFCTYGDELYFITRSGKVCKFNTDQHPLVYAIKHTDGLKFESNGNGGVLIAKEPVAIPCRWSTVLDDDGYANYLKTMSKKGSVLTVVPYDKSSVNVYYSKDGEEPELMGTTTIDNSTSDIRIQDIYLKKKLKKYKRLQMVFENNAIAEPFGLISVTKAYTVNNLAK